MHNNIVRLAQANREGIGEDRLALTFAERHPGRRYVALWNRWLAFNDTSWDFDDTLHTYDLIRDLCRELSTKAPARLVQAVERLARSDRRLAATTEQWDRDHWALNTPAGVVDLRTGELRPHRLDDYMTKIAVVAPDDACPTPLWDAFLDRVTGGDKALAGFLQRMAGYMLTGDTSAHGMFFLHGTGANGKSTFVSALINIMGGYHATASIETFTASHNDQHPTDLAGLRGARLVTSTETEEGRRWAENRIKALTGGDRISARFMRQDFFTYQPTFKLLIQGNHRPGLRSVDEAVRRRFHLVPFRIVIPPAERDENLGARLRAEWPGILAWAIAGCIDWQERGLAPPGAVTGATDAYLQAEDAITAWLEDAGTFDLVAWEETRDLFGSWRQWAEAAGEYVGTQKRFVQNLEAREGFAYERKTHARGFRGFRLVGYSRPLANRER